MKTICVYCGSSDKIPSHYLESAFHLGEVIADRQLRLVYGAGSTGLMGSVANGVLSKGGEVIGVIPEMFYTPTLSHGGLTSIEIVESMHARKARLIELAEAFIALPGGYGTLDELFETLTWSQIGLHEKPVGLLNTNQYFDSLLTLIDRAQREGFIYNEHRGLFVVSSDPNELLDALLNHRRPQGMERWLTRSE